MDYQINLNNVDYLYAPNTPFVHLALHGINLKVKKGEFLTIIGSTGSGKSTLIKLLNGLQTATRGIVEINGIELNSKTKKKNLQEIRSQVGMIFQSPEKQLFADTVLDDVSFGPLNFGYSKKESETLAKKTLLSVGIKSELFNRSPFELSGGQMRRVAIAGVLAMQPQVLVLDEPTVGLDANGKKNILELIKKLNVKNKTTIIMVTHDMNVVSEYSNRVVYLNKGQVQADIIPKQFFADYQDTVILPDAVKMYKLLKQHGIVLDELPMTKNELIKLIMQKSKMVR
ncbi:energy-coupling factor transporter ATPase [Fructilactobacillus lindneri]|uniref:Energy-coupling factor transporter ATP-binding protein EcfA2 n=2 Tax=Fructilactobacillus lindneri TaxID=53444 RepID=A0A0R2JN65_9LACO|nr:energy-coupling factor transporter ATPase [Fructilactobacillus lindneri]ANZ57951.1 energy-coupling factor transporter ATPase [Fructilactobacillus lindneri]ANZ59221.1 energy-coupling factor transporter ATPase [Fructilactobacillus lindneri]KRN78577.1 cobalt import ATP-binding protein cbiO 2 [Fructilactobacillus lindneri DSM 20690 = JCM 11027]POG98271.1 energy-coupling factor transporter ATPase [Fructilactobacillus lindneri]POH01612.1 energy-coupling factor transporter ATPase [Fructilactobacil